VFSHIYLDNLSPSKLAGFWVRAGRNELAVDNFLTVFFFNDFNAQTVKSLESSIFIDFRLLNSQWLWITLNERKSSPTSGFSWVQHPVPARADKNAL